MARLRIEGVSKQFGDFYALNDIHLDIPTGSIVCLLGPSGCGKTTMLRIIAGLETANSGRILCDGKDLSLLPPHQRDIGMVFQSHALFPHLSVADNIAYGLRISGVGAADRQRRVDELLAVVKLPNVADKSIGQLSGGQQQRVAIARALARSPKILLLDEPTASLDANLRETMQIELRRLQQSLHITTIVVTHDQTEAMTLADLIVVMHDGEIEQTGAPLDVYNHSRTAFVADFIGTSNRLSGVWRAGHVCVGEVKLRVRVAGDTVSFADGDLVTISVRPEKVELMQGDSMIAGNQLPGNISFIRNTGNLIELHVDCAEVRIIHTCLPPKDSDTTEHRIGDRVVAHLPAEYCLAYPA